ncbi:MAG: arylsulfatase, partial [Lentisphaeria bacterium]|nr:arylsulfatase [Lentisphaeria bacterium]
MPSTRPNIVYILADDMGYGDISAFNPQAAFRTPRLDQLAAEGMMFGDAHASSAVCTPSRYSILTGRYNWRSSLKQGVTMGYSESVLEPGRLTVAAWLRQRGYRTGCIGKWHLGWTWARLAGTGEVDFTAPIRQGPLQAGFESFFGISASLDMPPYVYVEGDRATAIPDRRIAGNTGKLAFREGVIAPDFHPETVLPTLERKAIDFIQRQSRDARPFFLYLPLTAPHTPILPGIAYRGKSGTNAYGDFCLQVDDVVGHVMDALATQGLAENTIVVFTSDNGCSPQADFAELARCRHFPSHIFRGMKADIYEGGHRIPLIVRWPDGITAGTASDETVCLADFFATCADLLGEALPDNAAEDSISNLPAWRGKALDKRLREATVHSSIDGSLSIRQGRWKLEMCPGSGGWSAPKPGEEQPGWPACQLYDLTEDAGEQRNLIGEHPEKARELQNLLTDYVRRGRSTPGPEQPNTGAFPWKQLWWMKQAAAEMEMEME